MPNPVKVLAHGVAVAGLLLVGHGLPSATPPTPAKRKPNPCRVSASLLAGAIKEPGPAKAKVFAGVRCMGYVAHDPALGWLNGQWLVGDMEGLKAVSSRGEVTPLPGVKGRISCLAARPWPAAPGNPHHVAFATFGSRKALAPRFTSG